MLNRNPTDIAVDAVASKHRRLGMRLVWLTVPLAWLGLMAPAASCACALQVVAIQPAAVEPTDTYIGRTAALELRFHNDKTAGPVEVFPEPPLIVKQLKTQRECAVKDGGVWVRQHVYASADGSTLVTHEYSGSNDELVFYDTQTCNKRAAVDVSKRQWIMDGNIVRMTSLKPGQRSSEIKLDAGCLPVNAPGASARR